MVEAVRGGQEGGLCAAVGGLAVVVRDPVVPWEEWGVVGLVGVPCVGVVVESHDG